MLTPTTIAAQTFNVPANEGETWFLGGCAVVEIVDYGTFDSYITKTLLPALSANGQVTPASLVIFVIHDVVMGDSGTNISSNCCVMAITVGRATRFRPMWWRILTPAEHSKTPTSSR